MVAWLAMQIAETLFPAFGTPEWVFKTLVQSLLERQGVDDFEPRINPIRCNR